jgi:dienelactone hydrolase
VIFAHGSGSSRKSGRNRYVARVLNEAGFGTLLMDLLTAEEEEVDLRTAHLRFDIPFLARRLEEATDWMTSETVAAALPIGYFGASTGAAAALIAAADRPRTVSAVVSRGGRPDLAERALQHVVAPTLLIVGGYDGPVIEMNRSAYHQLTAEKDMQIVPGATHLFEEPGTLEQVAELASHWFTRFLRM